MGMTSSPEILTQWTPLEFSGKEETGAPWPSAPEAAATPSGWTPPQLQPGPPQPASAVPAVCPAPDDSYACGFAEGIQAGAERQQEEIGAAIQALGLASEALNARREGLARELGLCVHALAAAVAHKVIQREIRLDPTIVRSLVDQALELIPLDAPVEIRMNREDLELLRDAPESSATLGRPGGVQLVPDSDLNRGSFLVESPMQIVDGRLDVALRAIYERLEYE